MNCEQCREEFLNRGPSEGTDAHAAECDACRESLPAEAALMSRLDRAGGAWRSGPMGDAVAERIRANTPSSGARHLARPHRLSRPFRLAAAAAFAFTAGSVIFLAARPTPANAMVLMVREIRERGTVRFIIEVPHGPMESGVLSVSGSRLRLDMANGEAIVADMDTKRTSFIRTASRTFVASDNHGGSIDLYAFLLSLADAPRVEQVGAGEIQRRPAEIVRAHIAEPISWLGGGEATLWIDLSTRLPLRVEMPTQIRDESGADVAATIVLRDFEFDVVLDESLFDTQPTGFAAAAPEATTPGVGIQMGTKIRNLAMAFHTAMQANDGTVPETIEELASYLEEGGLRSARRPEEPIGYVYVKPTLPLNYEALLAYERFAEGAETLWVVLVDGSAHVKSRAEFDALLRSSR
jgi:hypothetical protein